MAVLASNPGDREKLLGWMLGSDRATLAQAQSEMLATDLRERVAAIHRAYLDAIAALAESLMAQCPELVAGTDWYFDPVSIHTPTFYRVVTPL